MTSSDSNAVAWTGRSRVVAGALALAAFLTQFDVTAVVIVLPTIVDELRLGVPGFAWVMDAYSLAFTAALLAAGALADRFGRRRCLLLGNAVFLAASVACALAWHGPSLWAARVVQGVGAALLVTGALALIAGNFPHAAQRARVFGFIGVISGIAMALGPTLGGLLASSWGWRGIFYANVPLCLVLAIVVPRHVDESRDPDGRPFDLAGIVLLTLALVLVVDALLRAREALFLAASGLVASGLLLCLFAGQQRRRVRPLLDARVFLTPAMAGIAVLLFAVSFGYWAMLVVLPLYLGAVLGWSASTVGVGLLAATAPMLLLPPAGGRLLARWGWRRLFAVALAAVAAGDLMLVVSAVVPLDGGVRLGLVLAGMTTIGAGAALAHPQLSGAVLALAPADQAGMASAVTVVARQAGFAIGIAALGAVLGATHDAGGFVAPFVLASVASLSGLVAAWTLLPRGVEPGRQPVLSGGPVADGPAPVQPSR